ncbi:hypothetical protein D3C81_742010 [compost metagenome]
MRICQGLADSGNQFDPLPDRLSILVAPLVDGAAVEQGHDEPRRAVDIDTTIQDRNDVAVIQPRQRVAFRHERIARCRCCQGVLDELYGHVPFVGAIAATGAVDGAHPAHPDKRGDLPRADVLADASFHVTSRARIGANVLGCHQRLRWVLQQGEWRAAGVQHGAREIGRHLVAKREQRQHAVAHEHRHADQSSHPSQCQAFIVSRTHGAQFPVTSSR